MSPYAVDITCVIIAAVLPIPLVLRWNWLGVALGTLVVWGTLFIAGVLLSALDPKRDGGVGDTTWMLFGWVGGLMYCLPIYAVKRVLIWVWHSPRSPLANGADSDPRITAKPAPSAGLWDESDLPESAPPQVVGPRSRVHTAVERPRLETFAGDVASALSAASPDLQRRAAMVAAEWAISRTGLAHPSLATGDLERVAALAYELDEQYFAASDAQDAGQANTADVVAAFGRARAAKAVEFMLRGEPGEAIYEAAATADDWSDLQAALLLLLGTSK